MGSQNVKNAEVANTSSSPRLSSSRLNDAEDYYSAPTSPKDGIDLDHDQTSFEFVTSHEREDFEDSVHHLDHCNEHTVLLPTMAFADELFSDGQVAPLLKLPPRLQGDKNGYLIGSTAPSPPKSPSSVLRLAFSRKSLWNDEFDPFKAAMENVRGEKRGTGDIQEDTYNRRARSQSPLRSQEQLKIQENGISLSQTYKLSNAKGLGIANQLRPLQAVCRENNIHQKTLGEVCKTQGTRKNDSSKQANCYGEKWVAGDQMKSIIQHRPKLFLCLGLGPKPSRK